MPHGEAAGMQDILFLLTTLTFFAIAIGYAYGCERLKE